MPLLNVRLRLLGQRLAHLWPSASGAQLGGSGKNSAAAALFEVRKRHLNNQHGCLAQRHHQPQHQQSLARVAAAAAVVPATNLEQAVLDEVKVFQEEQIIQLTFKSGKPINYTMAWLRELCSCSQCLSSRVEAQIGQQQPPSPSPSPPKKSSEVTDIADLATPKALNVSRVRGIGEEHFEIEWIDDEYRTHTSVYNIKHLALRMSPLGDVGRRN